MCPYVCTGVYDYIGEFACANSPRAAAVKLRQKEANQPELPDGNSG